jgi:hypothetical protein
MSFSVNPKKWPDPLANAVSSYSLNPLKWHNASMNLVDQANRSNHFIVFKMLEQSGANSLAVCTGICATTFLGMQFVASLPGCLLKNKLAIIRFVTRDHRENRLNYQLPGIKDCYSTAKKTYSQFVGIFASLTGIVVIGSKYNAQVQLKRRNCEEYTALKEEKNAASLNALKPKLNWYVESAVSMAQDIDRNELMALASGRFSGKASELSDEDKPLFNIFVKTLVEEGLKKFNNEPNKFEDVNLGAARFIRNRLGRQYNLKDFDNYIQQQVIATMDKKLTKEKEEIDQKIVDARQALTDAFIADNSMELSNQIIRGYISFARILVTESIKKLNGEPNEYEQFDEKCIKYLKDNQDDQVDLSSHHAYIQQLVKVYSDNAGIIKLHASKEKEFLEFKRKAMISDLPSHLMHFKKTQFNRIENKEEYWKLFDKKILNPRAARTPFYPEAIDKLQRCFEQAKLQAKRQKQQVAQECHDLDKRLEAKRFVRLAIEDMWKKAFKALSVNSENDTPIKDACNIVVEKLDQVRKKLYSFEQQTLSAAKCFPEENTQSTCENHTKKLFLAEQVEEKFNIDGGDAVIEIDNEGAGVFTDDEGEEVNFFGDKKVDVFAKEEEKPSTQEKEEKLIHSPSPTTITATATPPASPEKKPLKVENSSAAWYSPMRFIDYFRGKSSKDSKEEVKEEKAVEVNAETEARKEEKNNLFDNL